MNIKNIKKKKIMLYSGVIVFILVVVVFISIVPFGYHPGNGGTPSPPPPPDPDPPPDPEPCPAPAAPILQLISPNPDLDGSIYLGWNVADRATGYKVYMSKDGGTWQLIFTIGAIAIVKSGLTNGNYRFKIIAYNTCGYSLSSNIRSVTVSIPLPVVSAPTLQLISPTTDTDGYITLKWGSVEGATIYKVYKSKDGGAWVSVVNTAGTSIIHKVSVNGNYRFGVKASNAHGTSVFSNIQSVVVLIPEPIQKPPAPILNTISPSIDYDGIISLDWNDVVRADSYKVYRNSEWGIVRLIASGIKESRYIDRASVGKWFYRIVASNEAGDSLKSNFGIVTVSSGTDPTLLPETPVLRPIVPNPNIDGKITLSWSVSAKAVSYDVFVCGVLIGSTTITTTYNDEITLDGVYDYKIRAKNGYGVSGYSNIESVTVAIFEEEEEEEEEELVPDSPILSQITFTIGEEEVDIQLSWSVVDCDSYSIYKSFNGGSYVLIESNLVSTTYSDVLIDAGLYSYRITAKNEYGESELSNPSSITLTAEGAEIPVDYTMVYVLLGVLMVLIIPVIIIIKKKKINLKYRREPI